MKTTKHQSGFTLIELMIVVAIVSILATLALPRFQVFQAKAKRSEATYNLGVIYKLQEAYRIENGQYGSLLFGGDYSMACGQTNNQIGFVISNCDKVNYAYYTPISTASDDSYVAIARSAKVVSGNTDCLSVDQNNEYSTVEDAITGAGAGTCPTMLIAPAAPIGPAGPLAPIGP